MTDDQETVPMDTQIAEFRKMMQDAMELFEDQVAKGNEKFAERFMASNQMNRVWWTKLSSVGICAACHGLGVDPVIQRQCMQSNGFLS